MSGYHNKSSGARKLIRFCTDVTLLQAVRNAVIKRLEWLDANFLAALNAYLAAPSVQRNDELSELLQAVRTEVLDLVSGFKKFATDNYFWLCKPLGSPIGVMADNVFSKGCLGTKCIARSLLYISSWNACVLYSMP